MTRSLILLLPVLAACTAAHAFAPEKRARAEDAPAAAPPASDAPAAPATEATLRAERKVVYTGSLALQVAEPETVEADILALARKLGGWVQRLDRPRITIRFPAEQFDEAFRQLAALGQVLDKKIQAADVTDAFLDLKVRLDNAEKVRARLAALLEQAKTVTDALAVEKELARLTEDIERFKGALAQMQDQIAFSTITVELRRTLPAPLRQTRFPFPWVRGLGVDALLNFGR
jgi:uncharacterized protein DUF4349